MAAGFKEVSPIVKRIRNAHDVADLFEDACQGELNGDIERKIFDYLSNRVCGQLKTALYLLMSNNHLYAGKLTIQIEPHRSGLSSTTLLNWIARSTSDATQLPASFVKCLNSLSIYCTPDSKSSPLGFDHHHSALDTLRENQFDPLPVINSLTTASDSAITSIYLAAIHELTLPPFEVVIPVSDAMDTDQRLASIIYQAALDIQAKFSENTPANSSNRAKDLLQLINQIIDCHLLDAVTAADHFVLVSHHSDDGNEPSNEQDVIDQVKKDVFNGSLKIEVLEPASSHLSPVLVLTFRDNKVSVTNTNYIKTLRDEKDAEPFGWPTYLHACASVAGLTNNVSWTVTTILTTHGSSKSAPVLVGLAGQINESQGFTDAIKASRTHHLIVEHLNEQGMLPQHPGRNGYELLGSPDVVISKQVTQITDSLRKKRRTESNPAVIADLEAKLSVLNEVRQFVSQFVLPVPPHSIIRFLELIVDGQLVWRDEQSENFDKL